MTQSLLRIWGMRIDALIICGLASVAAYSCHQERTTTAIPAKPVDAAPAPSSSASVHWSLDPRNPAISIVEALKFSPEPFRSRAAYACKGDLQACFEFCDNAAGGCDDRCYPQGRPYFPEKTRECYQTC